MKMKKIVSGLVAAVLALSLSAPAFAATPGEEAQSLSTDIQQSLYKDDVDAATAQMEQMTATLQDNSVTVSSAMNIAALAYYERWKAPGRWSVCVLKRRTAAGTRSATRKTERLRPALILSPIRATQSLWIP